MSARKTLVLGFLICGTLATTVHADDISWPSGLDNWIVYLAAPSGNSGTGPLAYTNPQSTAVAPQAMSSSPAPAPVQPAPAAVVAPQPAVQPNVYVPPLPFSSAASAPAPTPPAPAPSTPAPAPPAPVLSTPIAAPSTPVAAAPAVTVSAPPAPSQAPAVQAPAYTAPAASQPSTVQPLTYIQPTSSALTTAQPLIYTPSTVVASTPAAASSSATVAAPVSAVTSAAMPVASAVTSSPALATSPAQAFINVGNGPYPLAGAITTGGAQAWFNSSQLTSLFGGHPTTQQIQSFDNTILQRVQQTFSQSGVSVSLTENPNVPALHTISLVSGTASSTLSSAIGMTQVGSNGFSFIDQIAPSAHSVDQLEWIVAHNISHELMLAFGVPENYDTTGNFIDSKVANWAMMVNPDSTFQRRCFPGAQPGIGRTGARDERNHPGRSGSQPPAGSRADNRRHVGLGRCCLRPLPSGKSTPGPIGRPGSLMPARASISNFRTRAYRYAAA